MNRRILMVTLLGVAVALCIGTRLAWADDNEKPKGAPTLDDAKAMVTETVDGKEKSSTVELKYCLKVKAYFDKDGMHLEEVDEDGPAMHLTNNDGNQVQLEKGDIIREVDGKAIKSVSDYVKAMNGALDHSKVKVKVKDVRTGDDQDLIADTSKR
jgi:S1-C subfamily serine protease